MNIRDGSEINGNDTYPEIATFWLKKSYLPTAKARPSNITAGITDRTLIFLLATQPMKVNSALIPPTLDRLSVPSYYLFPSKEKKVLTS